jgi:acetate kinase
VSVRVLVLVLNSGSSSIKYQLIDMVSRGRLATGLVERIGEPGLGHLVHRNLEDLETHGDLEAGTGTPTTVEARQPFPDHGVAMTAIMTAFSDAGPTLDPAALTAIGHRVVHGGDRFAGPARIDDDVVDQIKALSPLAPLHNPASLVLIEAARRTFPDVPQVAVFDTAFHQTLPPRAHTYAVPDAWRRDLGVRRYGFHGTSHQYVSRRAAELLSRPPEDVNVIVLHLGNGASAAAIEAGRSVDTTMGLTPLEGLVMGTRSGDLDPAVLLHLHRVGGFSVDEIDTLLNRRSGMLGLCGDNDMREVSRRMAAGDRTARLAFDIYIHRLRKYIGAYYAVLGRVDAIAFTAGVGETATDVREAAVAGLESLGLTLDPALNSARSAEPRVVSREDSRVVIAVVPTDEELEIAQQTFGLVGRAA